jgi:hypothetical protein
VGCLFEQGGDVLVRFERSFAEVPGPPVGLIGPELGEGRVRVSPLSLGRPVDDRGADDRVAKGDPIRSLVDVRQAGALRRREIVEAALPCAALPEQTRITGAVERRISNSFWVRKGSSAIFSAEQPLQPAAQRLSRLPPRETASRALAGRRRSTQA